MTPELTRLQEVFAQSRTELAKVIIGQEEVINKILVVVFTGQHALIEGVPGVAKTLLVRTLARILGADFKRIQFTPDLMPADITGTNVFDMQNSSFKLIKGPVFTSFLLGDEINRAPAKTQSALLQAMQEHKVTIDRETYDLPENFTVFATQNPIEYEGTYPLPEAQKDRFMLKIEMLNPPLEDELELAKRMLGNNNPEQALAKGEVEQVVSAEELSILKKSLQDITIQEGLLEYIVKIVHCSRNNEYILTGAGPRATQALVLACRANAAIKQRDFVTPDDIKEMVLPVLGHRLILRPEVEIEGMTIAEVVNTIMEQIAVPR